MNIKLIPVQAAAAIFVIGTLLFLLFSQGKELRALKQNKIEYLDFNNAFLDNYRERIDDQMKVEVRIKQGYRGLHKGNEKIKDIANHVLKLIRAEQKTIVSQKQNLLLDFNYKHRDNTLGIQANEALDNIEQVLSEIKNNRSLGIRPKEFTYIKSQLDPFRNAIQSINDLPIRVNDLTYKTNLLDLEYQLLRINVVVSRFLGSKIGTIGSRFTKFEPFALATSRTVNLGDVYESRIILTQSPAKKYSSVEVDGKLLEHEDGRFYYRTTTKEKGEHQYEVVIRLKNAYTGKSDYFKKTFTYMVE